MYCFMSYVCQNTSFEKASRITMHNKEDMYNFNHMPHLLD